MTVFVACKFRASDTRTYTYAYEGDETFAPGDIVKVPDNRSDGWKRVEVVSVSDQAPPFPCKPILGRVEDVPAEPDVFQANDTPIDRDGLDPVVQF
ncbi:hypothetical protein HRJ34_15380 [Rhizorhabdus wittichii]|uniref:Uncharacterized protein n=1 Tax=Rhizorhabdus wittichii TaxID=160791 RepID=A0A975CYR0_9SPHN|nr:hypothetical protein [Rhizorhabdus wittichii]QTH19749.1 hypothetical protein HRJ34_15380 [Rhizorhabdus wittichii]